MRISLLLQREPFGEILENTLSPFLSAWTGECQTVSWHKKNILQRHLCGQRWLCNPYLNSIFLPQAHTYIFRPLKNEFGRSGYWWRRPAQRAYVFLATHSFTTSWFSPFIVTISPGLDRAKDLLILGGNHHIRLLDPTAGKSYVIKKSNSDFHLMENEISLRTQPFIEDLPVPTLCEIAPDNSWYSESYINGIPLNRLADTSKVRWAGTEAVRVLGLLAERTSLEELVMPYVESLVNRIKLGIRSLHVLSPMLKSELSNQIDRLFFIAHSLKKSAGHRFVTCQAHGDLQDGNILFDLDRIWLIDWEHTTRRQVGYDTLVYSTSARHPRGLAGRISKVLNVNAHFILDKWDDFTRATRSQRRLKLAIFALEEIDFHISENCESMLTCVSPGLLCFLEELPEIARLLHDS